MEIVAVLLIFSLLFFAATKKPKTYAPVTPEIYRTRVHQGYWEQRVSGYKLKRNIVYDLIKEPSKYGYSKGYTDQEMHQMGFQEYIIEPQYSPVWVPE